MPGTPGSEDLDPDEDFDDVDEIGGVVEDALAPAAPRLDRKEHTLSFARVLRGRTSNQDLGRSAKLIATSKVLESDWDYAAVEVVDRRTEYVVVEAEAGGYYGVKLHVACSCDQLRNWRTVCPHLAAAASVADERRLGSSPGARIWAEVFVDTSLVRVDENGPVVPAKRPPQWLRELDESLHGAARTPSFKPRASAPGVPVFVVDLVRARSALASLHLMVRKPNKSGGFGAVSAAKLRFGDLDQFAPEDAALVRRLVGGAGLTRQHAAAYYDPLEATSAAREVPTLFPLATSFDREMLAAFADAGRLFRFGTAGVVLPEPLKLDPPGALRLVPRVRALARDGGHLIDVVVERNGVDVAVRSGKNDVLHPVGWYVVDDALGRADVGGLYALYTRLRTAPLVVPADGLDEALHRLFALPGAPTVLLPEGVRVEEARPPLVKRALLKSTGENVEGTAVYAYEDWTTGPADATESRYDRAARRRVVRDRDAEAAAAAELVDLGLRLREDGTFPVGKKKLLPTTLGLASRGWRVEAEGRLYRAAGKLAMKVTSGVDWFGLEGAVDFDGEDVDLPRLLASLKKGERTVVLADGGLGVIPDDLAKRLERFAAFGKQEKGGALRFRSTQAALLDALLAAEPGVTADDAFRAIGERVARFRAPEPSDPPRSFVGELRPYQREGLGWLKLLDELDAGGCLADDMGLGKTVQVLALLAGRRRKAPSIVVAPRSLLFNWRSEAAKFAPSLKLFEHSSPARPQSLEAFEDATHGVDLVLTTYGLVRRDAPWMKEFEFDYAILDEAQAIKNAEADTAKAARLLKARRRLAMTGTPVENRLSELWSLFEFLQPGVLGSSRAFEAATRKGADPAALGTLSRALRPYLLRRTKAQVAPELPARTEQTLLVELEGDERRLYAELRAHYRAALLGGVDANGLKRAKIEVLTALLRLRQAACHPGLLDPQRAGQSSAKLDALLPALREVVDGGHKALVFSQFTSFLDLVEPRLKAEGIDFERLDGSTTDREAHVARFRTDPACRVFLISLKAGGLGLNLVEAAYVFLLDPWWNPAAEAQAVDRAHRIGQTKPVTAYRVVAKDTVEERVLELQQKKKELADAVIRADDGLIANLTREDLELLLG
jgi:superfamily II DNA or RNA helicase